MASGNFSTMNPLHSTSTNVQYSNGNLTFSPNSSWSTTTFTRNNMVIPKDKKIYMEVHCDNQSGDYHMFGVSAIHALPLSAQSGGTGTVMIYNGSTRINGTRTDGVVTNPSQGDIVGIAIDGSNNKVWFAVNNTWQLSGNPSNGTNELGTVTTNSTVGFDITFAFNQNSASILTANFGQDSSFSGQKTSGSANASDSNSVGNFFYTPPTDFLALSSANLSISDDIDPAQTDDDIPIKQFNAVAYTGNSSSRTITTNMQPDLVWIKSRSNANVNELYDSTRGATKRLQSNATNAEDTRSSELTGFSSSGFTLGSSTFGGTNYNSYTYVGWSWRANGGVTSSNTDGDVTSTVQSNTKAGFSIVQYVGNRSGNGTSTVGHGLGGVPDMFITKPTSHSGRWYVWHKGMSGASYMLQLNSDGAEQDKSANGAMSLPTSTVFDITWTEGLGENGETHIGYFWRSIEGYSKFGKFVGSGSETNSPFINLGFRPRMVFCKNIGASEAWVVADTARSTFNPVDKILKWNNANTEASGATYAIDIVSTGFKIRTSWEGWNQNGKTIIYGAWGDVPTRYGNTF